MPGQRFQQIPEELEAIQWTGDNLEEVQVFCGQRLTRDDYHVEVFNPIGTYLLPPVEANTKWTGELWVAKHRNNHPVATGSWIIKTDQGFDTVEDGRFQMRHRIPPVAVERLTHSEATLEKVRNGLRAANLTDQQITDAISGMQTEGILFRERIREQSP